jgi:hypothetical protein
VLVVPRASFDPEAIEDLPEAPSRISRHVRQRRDPALMAVFSSARPAYIHFRSRSLPDFPQPFHIGYRGPDVLAGPLEEHPADSVLASKSATGTPLGVFQGRNDLRFLEFRFAYDRSLARSSLPLTVQRHESLRAQRPAERTPMRIGASGSAPKIGSKPGSQITSCTFRRTEFAGQVK